MLFRSLVAGKGYLGIPTFHHSNTNNQFLFVNGRVVQDKSMNVIFKDGDMIKFVNRLEFAYNNFTVSKDW